SSAFRAARSSRDGCSGCGIPEPNHDHKADASTDTPQINRGRDWLPKEDVVIGDPTPLGVTVRDAVAARPPSEPLWESLRRSFDPLELHIAWANMLEPVVIERLDGPAETRHFRAQTLIHSALSCLDVALAGVDLPQREDTIPFAARPGIHYPEPLTTARP